MWTRRVVNGLVWMVLAAGLSAAVAAFGPSDDPTGRPPAAKAPGHDAADCRPCRADDALRGRPLPYEIDEQSVRPGDDTPEPDAGARLGPVGEPVGRG